jgi:predicted Zn-dependent peptidase
MYRITTLANGFRVATAEMPHMASVSLGLWVGIGSRHEPAVLNGACHFIEHMLFKGTRRRSARSISEAVEGIGGYLNAFTSEEITCFHARVHHQHFLPVLDVLMDMFHHSRFAPADVAKEREVIKEEIAMYRDQPAQHVQEVLNATTWPHHPLGRSITGTSRSLDSIHRPHLARFVRNNYLAANTVLVVAGNIRHAAVVKAAKQYAKRFQTGTPPAFLPAPTAQQEPRLKLVTQQTEQAQLAIGFRTCSRHDERRFALRLLNAILAENMSSRLFQLIREDLGLAYNIYSTPSFYADAGDLVISAGLDTDNLPRVLRLIMAEFRRCAERLPSAAELRRARDFAVGQLDLMLESTENQMNFVGEQILGYGRVTAPGLIKQRLAAVTRSQVRSVAADFFGPDRLNVALVSPLKSSTSLAPILGAKQSPGPQIRIPAGR